MKFGIIPARIPIWLIKTKSANNYHGKRAAKYIRI